MQFRFDKNNIRKIIINIKKVIHQIIEKSHKSRAIDSIADDLEKNLSFDISNSTTYLID